MRMHDDTRLKKKERSVRAEPSGPKSTKDFLDELRQIHTSPFFYKGAGCYLNVPREVPAPIANFAS